MSKNAKSPVITAASITATGMIFAAVIGIVSALSGTSPFANWFVSYLPPKPTPTIAEIGSTSAPSQTSTLIPVTSVPTYVPAAFSTISASPTCAWDVFSENNPLTACSSLADYGISISNDRLSIYLLNSSFRDLIGISKPTSADGSFSFNIKNDPTFAAGEIWLGVSKEIDPSQNSLIVAVKPGSSSKNHRPMFDLRQYSSGTETVLINNFDALQIDAIYTVKIVLSNEKMQVFINGDHLFLDGEINFSVGRIFIGYLGLPTTKSGVNINTEISSSILEP